MRRGFELLIKGEIEGDARTHLTSKIREFGATLDALKPEVETTSWECRFIELVTDKSDEVVH